MDHLNVNKNLKLNYTHSNVNLMASILKHYGVKSKYKSLANLDKILEKGYKNVCLLIFDGLGDTILTFHSEYGAFNESKIDVIDAVFPPTTVAGITTFESGLAPIEHGWLGWRMYFEDYNKILDVFTGRESYGGEFIDSEHQKVIGYEKIYSKIKKGTFDEVECHEIYPEKIKRNVDNNKLHQAKSIFDFFDKVSDIVNSNDKEKFIYGYWDQPDYSLHGYGCKSVLVNNIINDIETEFERCADVCEDTLFIITADHGLIDITETLYLNDYPKILDCLERLPDIDSRCMNFKILKGKKSQFEKEFKKEFGDHHALIKVNKALRNKLFGKYKAHRNCERVFGDYLAIARSNTMLSIRTEKSNFVMKAAHSGFTDEEIKVPLIVYENPKSEF